MAAQLYELDVLTITGFHSKNFSDDLAAFDVARNQYLKVAKRMRMELVTQPQLAVEPAPKNTVNIVVRAVVRKPH